MSRISVYSRGRILNEETGFWHLYCLIHFYDSSDWHIVNKIRFISKEKSSSYEEITEVSKVREEKRRKRLWEAERNAHG